MLAAASPGKHGWRIQNAENLLAIKGYGRGQPITVGELAERLKVKHHSAVELATRLSDNGLLVKEQDEADQRRVGYG